MLCHVQRGWCCAPVSTEWIVGINTVHGGECWLQFAMDQTTWEAPGEGTIRPQGPFPRTPNLLPLFSVPQKRLKEKTKTELTPRAFQR